MISSPVHSRVLIHQERDRPANQSSSPKVALPLLLRRRQAVRALTQENRHIPEIHAKALRKSLALAARAGLASEPGASRASKPALPVPLPSQAA